MGILRSLFGRRSGRRIRYEIRAAGTLIDQDGWFYREYTDPSDSVYTIRLEQEKPGEWRECADWCKVAGLNVPTRGADVLSFFTGSYRWLELEREPENPHDSNAIKIMGTYRDQGGHTRKVQLGYIPRGVAAELSGAEVDRLWASIRFIRFPGPGADPMFSMRFDLMELG